MLHRLAIALILILWAGVAQAANHYVRDGASGAANGTNWTDAWDDLPATLTRGDTYYVADGAYAAYAFNDAVSGTSLITIKKAIAADHGTETGWVSTYGDGQATFTKEWDFSTSYWVIDGQVGGGPAVWGTGSGDDGSSYGFRVVSTTTQGDKLIRISAVISNITIKRVDMSYDGNTGLTWPDPDGTDAQDGIYSLYGMDTFTFSYNRVYRAGRTCFLTRGAWTNIIIEYSYFYECTIGTSATQHGETWSADHSSLTLIWRYNWIEKFRSTGGLILAGGSNNEVYGNVFRFSDQQANGAIGNWTGSG